MKDKEKKCARTFMIILLFINSIPTVQLLLNRNGRIKIIMKKLNNSQ